MLNVRIEKILERIRKELYAVRTEEWEASGVRHACLIIVRFFTILLSPRGQLAVEKVRF